MLETLLTNLSFYIAEVLAVFLMVALLFLEATYNQDEKKRWSIYAGAYVGIFIIGLYLFLSIGDEPVKIFADAVVIDNFSTFVKIIMVVGTFALVYLSSTSRDIYESLKSEYIILSIGVLIGGMLLASANNMLTVYLGIETLSILSYVMASLRRRDAQSTEAGMKYALYGGIASAVMLYGISHIYGQLGTIQFSQIALTIGQLEEGNNFLLLAAFLLFFTGIGYKVASFPFHMWSPDVYEGSPMPVTAFFAIVPKFAGLAVLVRVTMVFFQEQSVLQDSWVGLIHLIAALTMTVGNVSAIGQDSIKRLLAYSSIGHVGMIIMGAVVLNNDGIAAILFYLVIYLFMTLAAFYIASFLNDKYNTDKLAAFKGLVYRDPLLAICMCIVLFSLAGIPPLSGFVAKFHMISVVVSEQFYTLAFIAVINSVIALFYYLKVVKIMVIDSAEIEEPLSNVSLISRVAVGAFLVPVVLLGIFWESLMSFARGALLHF